MDTYPQLFWLKKEKEKSNSSKHTNTSKNKGVDTMTPICTREMAPHTRQRFHFAASSFSRMYGVSHVTQDMADLCFEWALGEEIAPLDCLNHVDRYFKQLWKSN